MEELCQSYHFIIRDKPLNERFADGLDGKTLELSEEQITGIAKAQTDEEIEKVMNAINVESVDMSDLSKMTRKQKAAASEYAMRQAEIATFRDASALSNFITGKKTMLIGKKGTTSLGTAAYRMGNVLLESQLPFVKTPINVFKRAVDYSPLGVVRFRRIPLAVVSNNQ